MDDRVAVAGQSPLDRGGVERLIRGTGRGAISAQQLAMRIEERDHMDFRDLFEFVRGELGGFSI